MAAKYLDLYIDQGTDFNQTIRLTDSISGANSNIAGCSYQSSVRKGPITRTLTAIFSTSTINNSNGTILISMNAAITANIEAGRYIYDVIQTSNANLKSKVVEGTIIVTGSPTV